MNLKGIFSRRSSGQLESDQPDAPQGRQQALPRASQDPVSGSSTAALVPAASAPSASNSFAPTSTSAQTRNKKPTGALPRTRRRRRRQCEPKPSPRRTLALLETVAAANPRLLRAVGGLVDVSDGDICYAGESVLPSAGASARIRVDVPRRPAVQQPERGRKRGLRGGAPL